MKFFHLALLIAILSFSNILFAIDYSKYKLTFVTKDEKIFFDEVKTFLTLKTEDNQMIQIIHTGEMTEELFEKIIKLKTNFDSWQSIKVKAIQFIIQKDSIDFVILLNSFNYQNKSYLSFIPNGMAFFYQNNTISYDFRILKENQSHKFTGILENEKTFMDKFLIYINEKKPEEFIKKQEEAKKAPKEEPVKRETFQTKPFNYQHSIKVFGGSGTLAGLGYGKIFFDNFEPMIYTGIIYYDTLDEFNEKVTKMALPVGARLNAFLFKSSLFQPYLFAGAQYNLSLKNYESRIIFLGGIGQLLFKYFFAELSYMYGSNWNGFVIGFGAQYSF